MRKGGLEPPRLTAPASKAGVSAISPPPQRDALLSNLQFFSANTRSTAKIFKI
jgi:hypothetical protein